MIFQDSVTFRNGNFTASVQEKFIKSLLFLFSAEMIAVQFDKFKSVFRHHLQTNSNCNDKAEVKSSLLAAFRTHIPDGSFRNSCHFREFRLRDSGRLVHVPFHHLSETFKFKILREDFLLDFGKTDGIFINIFFRPASCSLCSS